MKLMKLILTLCMVYIVLFTVVACNREEKAIETNRLNNRVIYATLFPQYDFLKQIAKDKIEIRLLLPPGAEAHSFDPTPKLIAEVSKAEMLIFTSELMEPWIEQMKDSLKNEQVIFLDASEGISFVEEGEHEAAEHEGAEHEGAEHEGAEHEGAEHEEAEHEDFEHGGKDPHVWLDPTLAAKMVDNILKGLVLVDPQNQAFYQQNASEYQLKLKNLDQDYQEAIPQLKSKTIVYGGHFAFGYLAKRYDLTYVSPYKGFSPNAEPSPAKIVELMGVLENSGAKAVYFEENIDPKVARVLSDQAGAKLLLLHGAHNISKQELIDGITYLTTMKENLLRLQEGLGHE